MDNGTKYCSDSVTVLESSLHQAIVRALKQFDAEDEVTYLTLMKATIGEAIGLNGGTDEIGFANAVGVAVHTVEKDLLGQITENISKIVFPEAEAQNAPEEA